MKKIGTKNTAPHWGDYKTIARLLNAAHPELDVMMLHRERLLGLAQALPEFAALSGRPDQYALDDIRFEWFFLKKGSGEKHTRWRLSGNF